MTRYPSLQITRKTGEELFEYCSSSEDFTLLDFWQWAFSDLVNNAQRGILAEFIVAQALGIKTGIRRGWDAYDLEYKGNKIEVKSSAYIQAWNQKKLSTISFGIQPTHCWDYESNTMVKEKCRQADIYIFCLLKHQEQDTINPLQLDQWEFYILPRKILDERCPNQKQISLTSLRNMGPIICSYKKIKKAIDSMIEK